MKKNQPENGIVRCHACGSEWRYARKHRVLKAVTHKCTCHRHRERDWERRPFSLAGWWQETLLFDHATQAGVIECRHELQVRSIHRMQNRQAAQARYRKALETSYSPKGAVADLADSHGVLIKHQDGSPPTSKTVEYVKGTIDLLADAVAFLGIDLPHPRDFFIPRLVVSHTQGKHPFLENAGGLFRTNDGQAWSPSISVGCRFVDAGIHELSHAFDAYAGFHRTGDWKHQGWASMSIPSQILRRMVEMCNSTNLDHLLTQKSYAGLTEDEVAAARVAKIRGRYWRRPQEQFARAVEQLASAFALMDDRQVVVGVHAYDRLRKEKGQWDIDADEAIDFLGTVILNAFKESMEQELVNEPREPVLSVNGIGR